jgi:hypothetical protein
MRKTHLYEFTNTCARVQLREETRRLEEMKRERMRIEEEQRMEIVRQIKALESVPADRCACAPMLHRMSCSCCIKLQDIRMATSFWCLLCCATLVPYHICA